MSLLERLEVPLGERLPFQQQRRMARRRGGLGHADAMNAAADDDNVVDRCRHPDGARRENSWSISPTAKVSMKSTPRAANDQRQRGVRDLEHHELHAIDAEMTFAWQAVDIAKKKLPDGFRQ